MATIIDFPQLADREWSVWEREIRAANAGTLFDPDVINAALPGIREHWNVLFAPVTIEAPPRPIPGPLSEEQAKAIQSIIDEGAHLLAEHHKKQRAIALGRLISCELTLAYYRVHGEPGV